jgi:phospholipid/cholesterol/gamma-HCH transport system permease protein
LNYGILAAAPAERGVIQTSSSQAVLRTSKSDDGRLVLHLSGRLDSTTTGQIWREAAAAVARAPSRRIAIDASELDYCDVSGIALLVQLRQRQQRADGTLEIAGLRPEFAEMLEAWGSLDPALVRDQPPPKKNLVERTGEIAVGLWQQSQALVSYVGELLVAFVTTVRHPRAVRWKDTLLIAQSVGVNALPIVSLIGFLMGLIMAFQAVIPLGQFGAQIYVASLVGLSILRELGPLMTAIVVAGRSGSAFAAEIGTMKVREEIDALITMGLDPVRFLVVPRVIAAVFMTPLLTVYANLIGLLGGAVVLRSLGYSWATFIHYVQWAVTYGSLLGGLTKAFAFGILIAAIGCFRGLQTTAGARAVGDSTTSAVVSGIILIVIADGIFSVVYYYLGV